MPSGKIGISVDSVTGQVRMQFLTCSATLPDTLGFHVVPTACGSGKSTDIAEIAVKKKSGGVLIIVPTKKEADEMGARIGRLGGVSMPDIEVLHCQNGPAIGKYRSDPWSLSKKPILILTSVRPQIDPLILFLSYNGGIRELVLIDELINFIDTYDIDRLGTFAFSEEEGTPSFTMDGKVPEEERIARRDLVMQHQQSVSEKLNERKIGNVYEVIVDECIELDAEGIVDDFENADDEVLSRIVNLYSGRTRYDAPEIDCAVTFTTNKTELYPGDIVKVRITDTYEYDLEGEEVE